MATTTGTVKKSYFGTQNPFEQNFGYYRAVRHGQHIFVSGTTSVDPEGSAPATLASSLSASSSPVVLYPGNPKAQALTAFNESIRAIRALGGKGPEDVVRVKMFIADSKHSNEVGAAYQKIFGKHQGGGFGAAATMLVLNNGFVDPDMLVEVEVDAIVGEDS